MSLWVMADTHLSFSPGISPEGVCVSKPMDRFGGRWTNHAEKIARRWSAVVEAGDTVVIPGDISWAGKLEEAEADLRFLASLPGRKLLGKGILVRDCSAYEGLGRGYIRIAVRTREENDILLRAVTEVLS